MRIDNTKNNINFGLKAQTHEFSNKYILNSMKILNDESIEFFTKMVQRPDFDEAGLKIFGRDTCNSHFYFPPKTFRRKESFLDFDGKHNAFSKFNLHIYSMFLELGRRNEKKALEHAARSKHFLDDVSVSSHVQRGTIWDKYKDVDVHKQFETLIFENQEKLMKNHKRSRLNLHINKDEGDFIDLFGATVKTSLENEVPTNKNRDKWLGIAQKTFDLNLDSSRLFFNKIQNLFG